MDDDLKAALGRLDQMMKNTYSLVRDDLRKDYERFARLGALEEMARIRGKMQELNAVMERYILAAQYAAARRHSDPIQLRTGFRPSMN